MSDEPNPSQSSYLGSQGQRNINLGQQAIGSILITGDHNQIFRGDYVDLRDFYIEPWQILARVQLDRYVGRVWLEKSLDSFLENHDRGYFVLEGQAGLGKTSFLAHLAKSRHYVHHFAELSPGIDGALAGARNLAAQLTVSWKLRVDFDAHVPVASLGPEYLQQTICKAADSRDRLKPEEKIVILVDALDQVVHASGQNPLTLPRHLPKGVYVIVSQRPGTIGVSSTTARHVATIEKNDKQNIDDLKEYLRAAFQRTSLVESISQAGSDPEQLVEILVDKSQGIWIYAHFVIAEMEAGLRSPKRLDELPSGLWRYYADFFYGWKSRNPDDWNTFGRKLLAALAVCQDDIRLPLLCAMVGIASASDAKSLLQNAWASIVTSKSHRQDEFSFYHASSKDFALGQFSRPDEFTHAERIFAEDLASECVALHSRIADYYLQLWGGLDHGLPALHLEALPQEQRYGAQHLPFHLSKSERIEELHRLLMLDREGSHLWYQLQSAQDDLFRFFVHLDAGRRCAVEQTLSSEIVVGSAQVIRYSLILSSLNSIATNLPPPLLHGLLETELWSTARASSYAERCLEGGPRATALMQLLKYVDGNIHDRCVTKIMENVRRAEGSPSGYVQGLLIKELLTDHKAALSERDLDTVFKSIKEIADAESKLRALACLATVPLPEVLAASVYDFAKVFQFTGDDSLHSEIQANHVAMLRLQTMLRILRHSVREVKRDEIGRIIRLLNNLNNAGLWRIAIIEIAQEAEYDKIAQGEGLPAFDELVGRALNFFIEHSYASATLVETILPYLGSNKLSVFEQHVKPRLSRMNSIALVDEIGDIAESNPELLPHLVKTTEQHGLSSVRALSASRLVPFILNPSTVIDTILNAFEAGLDEPLIGESMSYLARSMSPGQLERATEIVKKLEKAASIATGLAHLGTITKQNDLVRQAISLLPEIRNENRNEDKVNRIIVILNASSTPNLMHLELAACQQIRDNPSFVVAVAPLVACLSATERREAIDYVHSLVGGIKDEFERAGVLAHFLSHMPRDLASEEAHSLWRVLQQIPSDRAPESKISGLLSLAKRCAVLPSSELLKEAIEVTSVQSSHGLVLKLLCLVAADAPDELQHKLVDQVANEFPKLSNSDQRYVLPKFAALLATDRRATVVEEVVRNTPSDKFYALGDICEILPTSAACWLAEQIDDEDVGHQVLPDLAKRLAVLGKRDLALDACERLLAYERLEALIGVAPELSHILMERALDLLNSAIVDEENPAQRELRDSAIAEICIRRFQLGDFEPAVRDIQEIENASVWCMAKLRGVPYVDSSTRLKFLFDARAAFHREVNPRLRASIRELFLGLPLELFSFEERLRLFVLSLELAAQGTRIDTLSEMRAFAPWFLSRWGERLASAWFSEILRIRGWWQ